MTTETTEEQSSTLCWCDRRYACSLAPDQSGVRLNGNVRRLQTRNAGNSGWKMGQEPCNVYWTVHPDGKRFCREARTENTGKTNPGVEKPLENAGTEKQKPSNHSI